MPIRVEPDAVIERLARAPEPPLIAIDGLPCSGKSTLAERIAATRAAIGRPTENIEALLDEID